MNFNHEELMLMMLYNTGIRLGLIHELRLMQCYLCLLYTSVIRPSFRHLESSSSASAFWANRLLDAVPPSARVRATCLLYTSRCV